jgi:hypothetical protein
MRLELDWVVGVIRIGAEDEFKGAEPGTRYRFVCSVMRKQDEAYLYGAHGTIDRAAYKLIYKTLKDAGCSKIVYERLNTEKQRVREFSTEGELSWQNNKK